MPAHVVFTTLDARLRFAIRYRRLVGFVYNGRRRIGEPHDYGVRDGRERLLFYQLKSGSVTDAGVTGWRLCDLTGMTSCEVLDETFAGTRHQPGQKHHAWEVLYARVEQE